MSIQSWFICFCLSVSLLWLSEPGRALLTYKSFYWKTIGELIQLTSPEQVHMTWACGRGPTQPRPYCGEKCCSLSSGPRPWRGLRVCPQGGCLRESGTTSKKKKRQICLCPSWLPEIKRLSFQRSASPGLTQQHSDRSHSSTPRLRGRVNGNPCFLTCIPLKEWVSSWVHHNTPGSKGQGARLLWC